MACHFSQTTEVTQYNVILALAFQAAADRQEFSCQTNAIDAAQQNPIIPWNNYKEDALTLPNGGSLS
jgi:hypothetical protein